MIEIEKAAAQGDVIFRKVKSVSEGFKAEKGKEVIVAHSETGHHHVAVAERPIAYFTNPAEPLLAFVKFDTKTRQVDIIHKRDWDTHETLRLKGEPGSVWEIRRQREHTPEGWRRVED